MKKLLFFTIAIAVTSAASAQIQFGAKAGLNLANLSVSPSSSTMSVSLRPSFHAGGVVSIPLFKHFSLQPEVMYSAQGAKLKQGSESGVYDFGYINVPVLFKYNDPSGFFAELGPQAGILVNAKAKSEGVSTDVKSSLKSTDFSGVLGIGYLSKYNVGIDARYNLGFTNILQESSSSSLKNAVMQVGVFYLFGESKHK